MSKIRAFMSMSLDGFTAGANVAADNPMGDEGERLHDWMFSGKSESEAERLQERHFKEGGAVVMGRRMFDLGLEPWGENPAFHSPVFVISHRPREKVVKQGGTSYTIVTDGIRSALKQARAAAGDKEIVVVGGANIIQQLIQGGWIDEIDIHLVPMLLGGGSRLFDDLGKFIPLEAIQVSEDPGVTHLRYHVVK